MIIGVTGKARSGKDTFAELLANKLFEKEGQRFVLMAYAHELKLKVQRDFDLSYDQLWGDEKESEDRRYIKRHDGSFWTAREILQAYGEFYRSIDNEFWVKELFRVIDDKGYKNVIVTDVRHPNEADPVKNRDGFLIKVTREQKDSIHGSSHISETAMDDYTGIDLYIVNNYGLKELETSAEEAVRFITNFRNNKRIGGK